MSFIKNIERFLSYKKELINTMEEVLQPNGLTYNDITNLEETFGPCFIIPRINNLTIVFEKKIILKEFKRFIYDFDWEINHKGKYKKTRCNFTFNNNIIIVKDSLSEDFLASIFEDGERVIYFDVGKEEFKEKIDKRKEHCEKFLNTKYDFISWYISEVLVMGKISDKELRKKKLKNCCVIANFDGDIKRFNKHFIFLFKNLSDIKEFIRQFYDFEIEFETYDEEEEGEEEEEEKEKEYSDILKNISNSIKHLIITNNENIKIEFIKFDKIENHKNLWKKGERKLYWSVNEYMIKELD